MNNISLQLPVSTEFPSSAPVVIIDGTVIDYVSCISIEDNFGLLPSKCIIRVGSNGIDFTGPITLNALKFPFGPGSRIVIIDQNQNTLFVGQLLKRHDQGSANNVVFTAIDDRVFLKSIYMRGCLVYDNTAPGLSKVKYIRRFIPQMNPGGYWNCVGATFNFQGSQVILPVFSPRAVIGSVYQSPEQAFPLDLVDGELTGWTPRRTLLYQCLLCNLDSSMGIQGITSEEWRSFSRSDRISWGFDSVKNLKGTDVAGVVDPLDRKMPDFSFRGQTIAKAINTTLDIAGTHDVQITYNPVDQESLTCISNIGFQPISFSAAAGTGVQSIQPPLVRGGDLNTSHSVYDFDVSDDYSDVAEQCIVEGAPIMVESAISNWLSPDACFALKPAWTNGTINALDDQELCFLEVINGGNLFIPHTPLQFVRYPPNQNTSNPSTPGWLTADGLDGRPLIYARTPAAVEFAWSMYPYVFKGYTFDSAAATTAGLFDGLLPNSDYSNRSIYPVLNNNRPVSKEQLQFFINNPNQPGNNIDNWLPEHYSIYMQIVQPASGAIPEQVTSFTSPRIRITGQNILIFEGQDFNINNKLSCLYTGSMLVDLSNVKPKNFTVNIAFPMDNRVYASKPINPNDSWLSVDYRNQLGGPPLLYVDSPDAFHEKIQINSTPGPYSQFFGGIDGLQLLTTPLTRYLPPGSEQPSALFAAERALFRNSNPTRSSNWRICGIRPEYRAGMWVQDIMMIHNEEDPIVDPDFVMNAPLSSVLYDFMAQETVLNGVLNMTRGAQVIGHREQRSSSFTGGTNLLPGVR